MFVYTRCVALRRSGTALIKHIEQGVALTGRNRTGLPCNVGRPTAHAPGGQMLGKFSLVEKFLASRQRYRRQTPTNEDDDRHQRMCRVASNKLGVAP